MNELDLDLERQMHRDTVTALKQALANRDGQIAELESAKFDAVAARVQAENDGAVLRGQIERLQQENEELKCLLAVETQDHEVSEKYADNHYQTVQKLLDRITDLENIVKECLARTVVACAEPKAQIPLRERMWALVRPGQTDASGTTEERQVQP